LVDNAAKYTPAEGSLEMRWWVDEDGGHFAVSDTGMGIPPEHIPRLTERFSIASTPDARALTGGSGLGWRSSNTCCSPRSDARGAEHPRSGSTFTCHFPPERVASLAHPLTTATA